MSWLASITSPIPEKKEIKVRPYTGKKNNGRRGTPVVYLGVAYPSLEKAAQANGITRTAVRWRLLNK